MAAVGEYAKRAEDAGLGRKERDAAKGLVDADRHFNKWELDEAVEASQWALRSFREAGDQAGVADALSILIRSLGSQENVEEAAGMARAELAIFRSLGDAAGEAKMLLLQSEMCYNREDQLDQAAALARDALQLFEEEGHERGQAQACLAMAEAQVAAGKHKAALHPAQRAARLFHTAGEAREELRALLLRTQADVSLLGRGARESTWAAWDEVLGHTSECLKLAQGLGDSALVASALCLLAEVHNSCGRYDEALKASTEASQLYYEHGSAQDMASALHWSADTHLKCERYKEAREVAAEIRRLGQENGDEGIEALAEEILESMAAPKEQEKEKPKDPNDDTPPPAPPPPGRLVRNQQGEVMDLGTGLAFKPVPMHPGRIADIAAKILASYTGEEFDNEIPLMQAGIAGPVSAELRSEWQRKHVPTAGKEGE